MASWYREVGGDYDEFFIRTPPAAIAVVYRDLGAYHRLQRAQESEKYASPSIPALLKRGFITWQTIQLLIRPQEHVPFLQKTLELFDIVDPETNEPFKKMLPSTCFPDKPDEATYEWYKGVFARFRWENRTGGFEARTDNPESEDKTCNDDRVGAFNPFENPMYRKGQKSTPSTHHVPDLQAETEPPTKRGPEFIWPLDFLLRPEGFGDIPKDSGSNATRQSPPHTHKQLQPTRKGGHISTTNSGLGTDADQLPSTQRTPGHWQSRSYIPHPSSKKQKHTSHKLRDLLYKRFESDEEPDVRTSSSPPVQSGPPLNWWVGPTTAPNRTMKVKQMQKHGSQGTAQSSLGSSQLLPVGAPSIISASQPMSARPSYHDVGPARHTPHQLEQKQEQKKHQEMKAHVSSASWASKADLRTVTQALGYTSEDPESAVVAALLCGKEEDATLLLQLGVDPQNAIIVWRFGSGPKRPCELPSYLQIWRDASAGHYSGTLRRFLCGNVASQRKCYTSLTWNWIAPGMSNVDVKHDIVLTSLGSKTNPGKLRHVQATTYQEYLASSRWSSFVLGLIEILNKAQLCLEHQGFSVCAQKAPLVIVTCLQEKLSIDFGHEGHAVSDLIEALDWLCKTLSSLSAEDGHTVSSATYHADRSPTVVQMQLSGQEDYKFLGYALQLVATLRISPLKRVRHNCWLSLFDACAVVSMPSSRRIKLGKGLGLSFDLMLSLAAVEFCVTIDGGIVFLGYQTALYPVAVRDGYAQFHLSTSRDGQFNPYKFGVPNRLLTDDSLQFASMKCCVGWCEAAHVNLGTRQLSCNVGYSGTRDHTRSLVTGGYAVLGQFGAANPLSSIVGLQKNFRYTGHRVRFTPTKNYVKLLHDSSRQSVVLYYAGQHRCWLVPKLSVLLHMSQIYASHCATAQSSGVPYVEPYNDATDIIAILENEGEKGIFGAQTNDVLFRELFLALSINLLSTTEVIKDSESGELYGFELMDVVREPGKGTCMKRLDMKSKRSGWLDLVNAVGTVIVCSELGEAISPAKGNARKNSVYNELPQSLDYPTATLPCLSRLLEQKGVVLKAGCDHVTISDKTVWKLTEDAFTPCPHSGAGRESCWERPGLVQQMARSRWYDRPKAPHPVRAASAHGLPTNGAVVFG